MNRLTDEQLGYIRVELSEMMLEEDGVSGDQTEYAEVCEMAGWGMNELQAYRRSGLTPEQVAEMAKELERVKRERDDERSEREYQECLVKERDATISLMEKSCSDCVIRRERDAAVYDLTSYHGDCKTCRHMADTSESACRACSNGKDNNWTWRGPCAENGGAEDGI